MIIGLDFDNVMVKSCALKAKLAQMVFGVMIPPALFRRGTITASRAILDGKKFQILTDKQYLELRRRIYKDINIAYELESVNGSLASGQAAESDSFNFIKALALDGHNLFCLTSHQGLGLAIAKKCIAINKLPIDCYGAGYRNTKAALAKKLKLDAYMDDDLEKLLPLVGIVPHLFLLDWAFNKHVKEDAELIERVRWSQFYERIRELSRKKT